MRVASRPALAAVAVATLLVGRGPVWAAGSAAGPPGPARAGGPALSAQEVIGRANDLIAAGKTKEAVALLREAAARDPKQPVVQFTLGSIFLRTKNYDGAIAAYQAGLAVAPANLLARRALATAQRGKGDLPAARATLEALWREAPTFRPAGEDLAEVVAAQGDRRGAIEIYRYLIETYGAAEDTHLARIHGALGKVLEADGDRAAALAAYREALRINPKHAAARAAIARLSR